MLSPILEVPLKQRAVLFQHKDLEVLRESTSGGLFTALASWVIEHGGVVYGAAYDDAFVVRHVGVGSAAELGKFRSGLFCVDRGAYSCQGHEVVFVFFMSASIPMLEQCE